MPSSTTFDRVGNITDFDQCVDRLLRALRTLPMNRHRPEDDIDDNSDEFDEEYPTADLPPEFHERLTKGDLKIILGAMRGVVRQELRRFLEEKWSEFGKYTAKGAWALVISGLVWLAIVVTHGWQTGK